MECTVTGRRIEIGSELRDLIDHRLLPLERLLGDALVSAEMVLASEHHLCVSELVVHARGDHRLHGLAEGPNWQTAVGAAVGKVMHQAQTLKGKWQGRRRHATPSSGLADGPVTTKPAPTKDPDGNNDAILAADASRPASSLVAHILPVCALRAPCRAGASTPRSDTPIPARVLMIAARPEPSTRNPMARFVVVTGLSGAGKSAAIRALEDLGYLCVDNLPTVLIPTLADLTLGEGATSDTVAVVVDARDRSFLDQFAAIFKSLRARRNLSTWLIFLEASDEALLRRFSETRRPHPLAPTGSVIEGILAERARLRHIKKMADKVLDTSDLTVHELRRAFHELSQSAGKQTRLTVTLLSFGYKYGVPVESDLLFDVRFLPNPYFVTGMRQLTGKAPSVRDYVAAADATEPFLEKTTDLLRFLIPQYTTEGKSYLTIGIGCTGGRHRSVAVVEQLKTRLAGIPGVRWRVKHRDIAVE